MIDEIEGFVFSRGISEQSRGEIANRNYETIEGNMAQREDRLDRRHNNRCRIDVSEQLKGESKKRWRKLFCSEGKVATEAKEGDING